MLTVTITDFFTKYSQDVLIVALLVAISTSIIDKFLTGKQKLLIKMFTPFILGIMLFFIFNAVKGEVNFDADTVYAGILSGSLSSGIFAFIDRIITGKPIDVDFTTLSIEGVLSGHVNKEFITEIALKIKKELKKTNNREETVKAIALIIKRYDENGVSDNEILLLSELCFDTVKNLNLC